MLKQEVPEVAHANQYSFPSSTSNYAFENSQQLNQSFANSQSNSQMQGLPSFSGVMVRILQASVLLSPLLFVGPFYIYIYNFYWDYGICCVLVSELWC